MSASGTGFGRLVRTARHLSAAQIVARLSHLRRRRRYARSPAAPFESARRSIRGAEPSSTLPRMPVEVLLPGDGAEQIGERAGSYADGAFAFLGRERRFDGGVDWHDLGHTPLWRYQMHYLQPVLDMVLAGRVEDARSLLATWRAAHEGSWHAEAWHPYPASLRLVNFCHAAAAAGSFDVLGDGVADLVATHAAYVHGHLETDVRGNHLLENARALLTASCFFTGPPAVAWDAAARKLLSVELPEQILADGAHFELSPMYHCIVLQRLIELAHLVGADDTLSRDLLIPRIDGMATHLVSILCPDGDIPLLGDSARGFGPSPAALLAAAAGLTGGSYPTPRPGTTLRAESGIAVFRASDVFAVFDVGRVCPDYLPAHAQADALTVEVWIGGVCVVADPGVHDYVGPERAWGRSSRAHSTVTLDDRDSSEVYGSFRVGGRATVTSARDSDGVHAELIPWADDARISRRVSLLREATGVRIEDAIRAVRGRRVRARLQLHEDVRLESCGDGRAVLATSAGPVVVTAEGDLHPEPSRRSPRFGERVDTIALVATLGADAAGRYAGSLSIEAAS